MSKPNLEDSQFFKLFCNIDSYSGLPDSWTTTSFENIIEDVTDSKLKLLSSEIKETGEYAVVDQGQKLVAGYTSKKELVRNVSLPVIVFGDHTRCFKYIDFPFVQGADGTRVLKAKIEQITKYLYFFFLYLNLPSKGYSRHYKYLKQVLVPICNEYESNRIVSKIESAQEKVKSIEASISKADELIEKYREALLQKAFRGELVPQDPKDEPASKLIERIRAEKEKQSDGKKKKKDDLPPIKPEEIPFQIPASWVWVRAGDVIDVRDGTHDSPKQQSEGIPLITSKNLDSGKIVFDNCSFISREDHEKIAQRSAVAVGDLLMAMIGTIGNPVVVVDDVEFSIKNVALFKKSEVIPDLNWLKAYIDSSLFKKIIQDNQKGSTQKFLGLGALRSFILPVPPKHEQRRILERLHLFECKLNILKRSAQEITKANRMVSESILESAFSGNLVNQIPSEGTGHQLIESIRSSSSQEGESKARKVRSKPGNTKRVKK